MFSKENTCNNILGLDFRTEIQLVLRCSDSVALKDLLKTIVYDIIEISLQEFISDSNYENLGYESVLWPVCEVFGNQFTAE